MIAYSVAITDVAPGVPVCPTAAQIAATPNTQFAGTAQVPASVHVQNTGAETVYLGGSGVTSAAGFPLEINESIEIDLQADSLYAICATAGSSTVAVLRTS